ncbi:DUF2793 domain-containing protein [Tropicimonas sediminicola]|uniref:Uncharacterized protein n=1 Tax=Tropicimonas sediminicola TaxID=1031541 RepID=A0A239EDG3_9RHOB|nr:DUF2793 domain-containing protein [Tropicimonas sediminicola]SNS42686.1 Protein of unknown function [Tropicimonas sediminicola]
MTDTPSLTLPLLQPAQAQKHVTVNEALVRLDGLTQLRLKSRQLTEPPATGVVDGDCYAVAAGAQGDWVGQAGRVAIGSNGGWVFAQPLAGWRAWIEDEYSSAVFLNGAWSTDWLAGTDSGAASRIEVIGAEHVVAAGSAQNTTLMIPKDSMVFACSARVTETLTGGLSSWSLGTPATQGQFGAGMGVAAGSYCTGLLSQPMTFYAETAVRLTPTGGTFGGGKLRLALHCYRISLPG